VEEQTAFVSRVRRLPLLDADGMPIGKVDDVVVGPRGTNRPPKVIGFVVQVQRRQIFLNANRVSEVDVGGVRLRTNAVDLRRFRLRAGELLATQVVGQQVNGEVVSDLALGPARGEPGWCVHAVHVVGSRVLRRRRAGRVVPWSATADLWCSDDAAASLGEWWDLHPADLAVSVARLPGEGRRQLAELLDDENLADVLAELPDATAGELLKGLDVDRAADVLQEMEADDAADVLNVLPRLTRDQLLGAMAPGEAIALRRLLSYGGDTAGGLMNPAPVVMPPHAMVAEALARIRDPDVLAAEAAQVFVVEPPLATPTGRYLGTVSFQRLLREPPSTPLGRCVRQDPAPLKPDVAALTVARRLAAYDSLALPVCDEAGRLLGAVSVDDVLDRLLPEGWRSSVR
jgi:CBS domain-containing protein